MGLTGSVKLMKMKEKVILMVRVTKQRREKRRMLSRFLTWTIGTTTREMLLIPVTVKMRTKKRKSDSDDEGAKKKSKGTKKKKKKNKTDVDEAFEDSDDGDDEGREVDYMSDESSDSEEELEKEHDIKGGVSENTSFYMFTPGKEKGSFEASPISAWSNFIP